MARFKRSVMKIDNDPTVDEHVGPTDDDYIFNIGYTQTSVPALTATAPPEFISKTGYYGKEGVYYIPTGVYKDHSIIKLFDLNNAHGWDGAESCENQGQKDEVSRLAIPNTYWEMQGKWELIRLVQGRNLSHSK